MVRMVGKKPVNKSRKKESGLLGDVPLKIESFPRLSSVLARFTTKSFTKRNLQQKMAAVSLSLLSLIKKAKPPVFLLPAVVDYIAKIQEKKILPGYNFAQFELWLNQFSGLDEHQNMLVRAKIAGQYIPRCEYQEIFPVGMDRKYAGSHFITAHSSPDLDTIVASFWGFVDAFAARVGRGQHLWNIPNGPPSSIVELDLIFYHVFGKAIFEMASKSRTALALTAIDLSTQRGVQKVSLTDSTAQIERERYRNAIVIVDQDGNYLGDWRSSDVEGLSQVTNMFNHFLRWFEVTLQMRLISLFAKKELNKNELPRFIDKLFKMRLEQCDPAKELSPKQRAQASDYITHVLGAPNGIKSSFSDCAAALKKLGLKGFADFKKVLDRLIETRLFRSGGELLDSRPQLFQALERVLRSLLGAIKEVKNYTDTVEVALQVKEKVFRHTPQYVAMRSNVEEVRSKIANYEHISVVHTDEAGARVPVGVIYSHQLSQMPLGTVTVRDFCNREEVKIPQYFEIISSIDHHKASIKTSVPGTFTIGDAQSANILVAEKAMLLHERYSAGGMSRAQIERQIEKLKGNITPSSLRMTQRLLSKLKVARSGKSYFVDPMREFVEYMHYIYAILDDTDLLSKVSARDVLCVGELLNRMKSISKGRQTEIITLDDIPKNPDFPTKAAARILRHKDMYSLYKKVYMRKQELVEKNIELCGKGRPSTLFLDTKEQNGCCRVGQTKLFCDNIPTYKKYALEIQRVWHAQCEKIYSDQPEIDLFLHMISTIPSADTVFEGKKVSEYWHQDELWIWTSPSEQAIVHLKQFLSGFCDSSGVQDNVFELECLGKNAKELQALFKESFLPVRVVKGQAHNLPIAVLRYKAGSVNSRKAMITPFLPKLVN